MRFTSQSAAQRKLGWKQVKKFAWYPQLWEDTWIWLESYYVLYKWDREFCSSRHSWTLKKYSLTSIPKTDWK